MKTIKTTNPFTGKTIKSYELISDDTLNEKLDLANQQFKHWKSTDINDRCDKLTKVAELLLERK